MWLDYIPAPSLPSSPKRVGSHFPILPLKMPGISRYFSWILCGKDSDAGRDWGQEKKRTTEDVMAGWHHRLNGREFEWSRGIGDGQGGLACCDSWGRKELDTTEQLNWTQLNLTDVEKEQASAFFPCVCNSSIFSISDQRKVWEGMQSKCVKE